MKPLATLLLLLCVTSGGMAQSKFSPHSTNDLRQHTLRSGRTAQADEQIAAYLHLSTPINDAIRQQLAQAGATVNLELGDIVTVRFPRSAAAKIEAIADVRYIQFAQPVTPQLDMARQSVGADLIHSGEGLSSPYTGQGVVVGIIDAGFDYTHPAFLNADGTALRINRVWEQETENQPTFGTHPQGFDYGTEFLTSDVILRAGGDVSGNSHGTHVANIAAGANCQEKPLYGIAPDADLVLVSKGSLYEQTNVNISDGIAYIFNYAAQEGKPAVVNMSLGTQIGPHDGTSIFDQVCERLIGPGKVIVGSSGNFGADKIHISKTFGGADDTPLRTCLYFKTVSYYFGEVDFWGDPGMDYDVCLSVLNASGEVMEQTEAVQAGLPEGTSSTYTFKSSNNAIGSVSITAEINPFNQKSHLLLSLNVTRVGMGRTFAITVTPRSAGTLHAWADDTYVTFTSKDKEGYTDGDTNYTLAEIGGTGKAVISVGAYTTRNTYTLDNGNTLDTHEEMGALASFSSYGPALDGRSKPEVCAPGTYIASAASSNDSQVPSYYYPQASSTTHNGTTYYYCYMQGTSMAAPVVAGSVALLLQANPQLAPSDVLDALAATSTHDDFTSLPSPAAWGYGKLNAYKALQYVLNPSAIGNVSTTATEPTLALSNGTAHLLLSAPAAHVALGLYDAAGRLCRTTQTSAAHAGQELTISTADLPAGVYVVRATTDGTTRSYKISK